ncbi:MAG: hypothetical protein IIC23_00645 [Chloroflexi bacterium]|nr:hypothetical protein [Chloroflexota bacterium]
MPEMGKRQKMGAVSGVNMVLFKSCPRCSGDRTLEEDLYGYYILCLACGYVSYPTIQQEQEGLFDADVDVKEKTA